jgi:crotonobetainyl-CoA:carnitine CoA-transferase CaiB-like acyl-CoA transferase
MIVETPEGLKLVASPIKWDGHDLPVRIAPPRLGQHTDELLRELGYADDAIDRLRGTGVI